MRFLTALKSGVSTKNVAFEFVQVLLKTSWEKNELNLQMACDFVNDILLAIGLECALTPDQINNEWSYIWPMEQIQIYNFRYIEMDFKKLEAFLREICALTKVQNEIFINEMIEFEDDDFESPVEFLMQLVAVWCSAFKQLQKLEEIQTNKRFEEPFARINFNLLLGMHELRQMYRLDLHLLDAICNRLYWSALQGLFYRQTHDMIFNGLLDIFSKNYDLFYASSRHTINFFYESFAVEINTLTPLKLYQTLQDMLLEKEPSQQMEILLNFLTKPYMLRVYFTTFIWKKHKWYDNITTKNMERIQQTALKFLNVLQSKLSSLNCFNREFMEALLNLVFKADHKTSSLAINLYITMMRRAYSEQMILRNIMNFYVDHLGSLVYLKTYVQSMHGSFEFLLNFNNLLEIITDNDTEEIIRLLSAHIFVAVFESKVNRKDSDTKKELQHLLQILPEVLENLCCQKTEGILLKVYTFMRVEKLNKPVLDNFIHYAVGVFTYTDSPLEYPLLMNIFSVFHKCLVFNKEWHHLELLSDHLLNKYYEMSKDLQQMEQQQPRKSISKENLQNYGHLIKRLNILFKLKYDLLDNNYLTIVRNLSRLFLYNKQITSLIDENTALTNVYVLEIIISCILKLSKQQNDNHPNYNFLPEAQELFMFLWSIIENLEDLLKFPIVKIKTYFCCFLQLFIHLPLKHDNQIYHQLVQILIAVNFKKKLVNQKGANELQQLHPLQSLEYQHLMMRQFTEMHKFQKVQINTNMVWKLCIYYGMFKHKFQEDLKNLLITLANYRLKIYKHIVSVMIYNLYKQTPSLKHLTIVSILKQHKHLIDNDIKVDSSQLLKVHVVLSVLQILVKALSVQRIKTGHNRLEALRHLNIFIEDLDLNQSQAKQLMQEQSNQMEKHLMDVEESKLLADFKMLLN